MKYNKSTLLFNLFTIYKDEKIVQNYLNETLSYLFNEIEDDIVDKENIYNLKRLKKLY